MIWQAITGCAICAAYLVGYYFTHDYFASACISSVAAVTYCIGFTEGCLKLAAEIRSGS